MTLTLFCRQAPVPEDNSYKQNDYCHCSHSKHKSLVFLLQIMSSSHHLTDKMFYGLLPQYLIVFLEVGKQL